MKKKIKALKKVVCGIVVISAIAGIVAGVTDQIDQAKERGELKVTRKKIRYMGTYERFIKRPLDACLSTGALIVFSPIMATTAILVHNQLGSPVFFTQERPGKINQTTGKERIFKLYKFRSMTDAKDENGNLLPDEDRLTKLGKILRATSLDELPELLNIIKGDMAVVGPRPLLIKYLPYYSEEERKRHLVRPGLTGLSQIHGRNNLMWNERIALDVQYVENINLLSDIKIIFFTLIKVIKRSDVAEKRIIPFDEYKKAINLVKRKE